MTGIRVCPERDAACPHGLYCPWAHERYSCKPGWQTTPQERVQTPPDQGEGQ
jgi:hypothetical protein